MRKDRESLQFPLQWPFRLCSCGCSKLLKKLEARVGIEPTHKGFADLSLTTWVPRLDISTVTKFGHKIQR